MKLLVLMVDALSPDKIQENIDVIPNIKEMIDSGISGRNNWTKEVGSSGLWMTLYTGVGADRHGVSKYGRESDLEFQSDSQYKRFIWNEISKKYKIGMINLLSVAPAPMVNGYSLIHHIYSLRGYSPVRYPETKEIRSPWAMRYQKGISLSRPEAEIDEFIHNESNFTHYHDELGEDLRYFAENMEDEDVALQYIGLFDGMGHWTLACPNIYRGALKMLDDYIGWIKEAKEAENIIILADHSISPYRESRDTRRIEDHYVKQAVTDYRVALGYHSVGGFYCIGGQGKGHKDVVMEDWYPTILEILGISYSDVDGRSIV